MKKCPFCFEDIKKEAIFCKHCKNDLTTQSAKKAFAKVNEKSFKKAIKREEYLNSLSDKERAIEEDKEERSKWIKILWLTTIVMGITAFEINAYIALIIFLLAIWIHPTKNQTKPRIDFQFKDLNKYKLRIFFSILVFVFCIPQGSIQTKNRAKEIEKQKQEEFIRNYPIPKIEIISSQENQENKKEYFLEFKAKDFTNVLVNGEEIFEQDSDFQKSISLDNAKTTILIVAKNEHKTTTKKLIIERNETQEEENMRIKQEEEERIALAEAKEKKQKESDQKIVEQLQREINSTKSFDSSKPKEDAMGLQIEIALFGAWAMIIDEGKASENEEVKKLANTLESQVKNIQLKEFPEIRKSYGKIMREVLWEHNVEVKVFGNANATIELVGALFANNANIKKTQESLQEMLKLLRFDRVNYKWYEYDNGYYYEIKSLKDSDISSKFN